MSRRHTPPVVKWVCCGFAAAVAAAVAPPRAARAGVVIVGQSASVDAGRQRASFALQFDARPDFRTADSFGRVADSFQYEIDADGPAPGEFPVDFVDAVVRGDEIRAADALRVRGGLDDTRLTFEVPLSALGDGAADGVFSYRVFTTEFGLTTSAVESSVGAVSVPLPPGAWAAVVTAGGYV